MFRTVFPGTSLPSNQPALLVREVGKNGLPALPAHVQVSSGPVVNLKTFFCFVCARGVWGRDFVRSQLISPETNFKVVKCEASCLHFTLMIAYYNRLEGRSTIARTPENQSQAPLGFELALSELRLAGLPGMLESSGTLPQWADTACPPPSPYATFTLGLSAWTLTSCLHPAFVLFVSWCSPHPSPNPKSFEGRPTVFPSANNPEGLQPHFPN